MLMRSRKRNKLFSFILTISFLLTMTITTPAFATKDGTDIKVHINQMVKDLSDVDHVDVTLSSDAYEETVHLGISGNFALGHIDEELSGRDVATKVTVYWVNGTKTNVTYHVSNATSVLNIMPKGDDDPLEMPTGNLTITKALSGDPAPTTLFQFTIEGPNLYSHTVDITGAGSETVTGLTPGEYTITETDLPDHFAIDDNANLEQTATVVANQTASVSFTNVYTTPPQNPTTGSLTITKVLTGDTAPAGSQFTFSVTSPSYSHTVDITGAGSETLTGLTPGEYTITETDLPDHFAIDDNANLEQTATVVANQTASVSFTNVYTTPPQNPTTGSLTITKVLTGDTAPTGSQFTFSVTGPSYSHTVDITGAGSETLTGLTPGEYTITETDLPDHFAIDDNANLEQTITVVANQTASVSFTNIYTAPPTTPTTGNLTITKALSGDPAPTTLFNFTIAGPNLYSHTVDITGAGSETVTGLTPGIYTVTEINLPSRFSVVGLATQTITVAGNETAAVSFTNNYKAPGGGNPVRYQVTVNYYELGTDKVLHAPYSTKMNWGADYDLTDRSQIDIDGYTWDSVTGDDVTGQIKGDIAVNVYYTANAENGEVKVTEPEIPLGPAPTEPITTEPTQEDGIIILDDDTPLGELPKTGTGPAPVSPFAANNACLLPDPIEITLKEEDTDEEA